MTITTQYVPNVAVPNVAEEYPFTFPVIDDSVVEVYEIDAAGVRTQVSSNDYTVALVGVPPVYDQGTVTLTRASDPGTVQISVERNTPITQTVDLQTYGRFPADIIEFMLDKATMIMQEIAYNKCDNRDNPP